MDRLKRILVGVDFSESSLTALRQALRIARWNDAEVRVFHVAPEESQRYLPTDAEGRLKKLLEESGAADTAHSAVAIGRLLPETLRQVATWTPDLLVIGAFGPLGQYTGSGVGSFATQCMRYLPCKVLAVHHTLRANFDRVMACVDFSNAADRALEAAIRITRQEAGELHVFHTQTEEDATQDARSRMEEAVASLAGGAVDFDVRYETVSATDPGRSIIEHARHIEAHLIALGITGKGNLGFLLSGSTAEKVLRSVHRSVLITKPEGFVSPADRH